MPSWNATVAFQCDSGEAFSWAVMEGRSRGGEARGVWVGMVRSWVAIVDDVGWK